MNQQTKCPTCGAECEIGGEGETHYFVPITQAAITKAQDEAYEMAALACDEQANEPECPERAQYCAAEIRNLKSKP